jgi:hypothetical protein
LLTKSLIDAAVQNIRDRSLSEGGFSMFANESYRPDSTAWAIMAMKACFGDRELTVAACRQLSRSQLSDGRVPIIEDYRKSYWPTSIALLAWNTVDGFEREKKLATKFLLTTKGKHWPKQEGAPLAHDTSIIGWPWVENTHSWIEPTSMAILALKVGGYIKDSRVSEAKRMILDRQLESGGWNYGNTRVFGAMLRPGPACTGQALNALSGLTERKRVELSLDYLHSQIKLLKTPLALSWAIFGLTAWSYRSSETRRLILDSLLLQKKYGIYDTTLLSQLVIAYMTFGDFLSIFS